MAARKVVCVWSTGTQGGSGISTFYGAFGTDITPDLNTFWGSIKALFSDEVSVQVPPNGDVIDESTGLLTGAWTGGTSTTNVGTTHSAYPAGTGAFIKWNTGVVVGGHRVVGRTFIAPILANSFDTNGTLTSGVVTIIQNAANVLAATGRVSVWHRPPVIGSPGGSLAGIVSATVPDKTTSLRSRRH